VEDQTHQFELLWIWKNFIQGYKIQYAQGKTHSIDTNSAIQLTPNSKSILNYVEKSLAAAEENATTTSTMDGHASYNEVWTTLNKWHSIHAFKLEKIGCNCNYIK
jgi:hypothetical protein